MRPTILTALLTAILIGCSSGCGLLGSGPDPATPDDSPVSWPDVVDCVIDGEELALQGDVSDVLFQPGGLEISDEQKAALEALARKYGEKVIACTVEFLVKEWTRPGASANESRAKAALRGRDFLQDVGTKAMIEGDTGQGDAPAALPEAGAEQP